MCGRRTQQNPILRMKLSPEMDRQRNLAFLSNITHANRQWLASISGDALSKPTS